MKITIDKNTTEYAVLPGFFDVHVHLREPGFLYKETIATGTAAAAAGGFTGVCTMPNLDPCPDSVSNLNIQLDRISKDAIVNVFPLASITQGEEGKQLSELICNGTHESIAAFSDDGRGVMDDALMKEAMKLASKAGKLIVAHCEDETYPRESSEAEWKQLQRDLKLVAETGCGYHACHISTWESVELIGNAKAAGLDVTCETAPHYLLLSSVDVERAKKGQLPGRFKMNPPIKTERDRQALMAALKDGTIDMLATDHAPHSAAEKSGAFSECAYGIVGLETAFPVLYTNLVLTNEITMDDLIRLMSTAPAKRFGLKQDPENNYSIWDLKAEYTIDPDTFLSKGRSTPFDGWKVNGRCMKTVVNGKEVYAYDTE